MKRLIFAFIALTTMAMEAQNITDAVRYSTSDLTGTARYRAMSGAFGALGGDLSSLNTNPAGSAVFLRSFSSISLNLNQTDNEVGYFNGFTTNSNNSFDMGQAGVVFVFNSNNEDAVWTKFSLGFNYGKTADFKDNFLAAGTNPSNSIDDYFLGYANGVPLELLQLDELNNETLRDLYSYLGEAEGYGAQQALLGYQGFIINGVDETDPDNIAYTSAVGAGNFDQEYSYAATGLNGKFSFNFATQFRDNLYLGVNLNSHFLNYDRVTTFFEANDNPQSEINEIYFEDRLSTLGSGFSFQLGGIAKLGNTVRLGAAYESPTWYTISEETTQYLDSYSAAEGEAIVDPEIVNIYPDYKIQTPGKYTGSLAFLFGTQGLISFDYSYKDYSTTRFRPTGDPEFSYQNDMIQNELKAASIYRVGGEYRIEGLSLRGGYRYEESPYADELTLGDIEGYSLGLGYNFGNARLDLAYDTYDQQRNPQLFQVGLTDTAYINRNNSNFTLTLSFGI